MCWEEYDGQLVNIGQYQACINCRKVKSKPPAEMQAMARIVPDARFAEYLVDAETEPFIDHIEQLASRQRAGWWTAQDFGQLDPWEAELLMFWIEAERIAERESAMQAQQTGMAHIVAAMFGGK